MSHTLLAFHAHPDDESLLTAGTMARAAAQGHRVILVVATDGNEGLASSTFAAGGQLGQRRLDELRTSAQALGVARVEYLGYADSGLGPETSRVVSCGSSAATVTAPTTTASQSARRR